MITGFLSLVKRKNLPFLGVVIGYLVLSPFLSYAYDEAFYFQYFRWTYLYHVQPYFLWVFGTYYNAINVGSLGLNIPFYFLGLDNVLVQQFSQKLPLILSAILVSYIIPKILRIIMPDTSIGKYHSIFFLLLPVCIFYVDFMANSLIIALIFLILFVLFLLKSKPKLASILLGISTSTFLYPIFFVLPFIYIVHSKQGKRTSLEATILLVLTVAVGQGIPVAISVITGTPPSYTVLAPFFGHYSSITVTTSAQSPFSIYYLIAHFNIGIGAMVKEVIFFISMSLPVLIFFLSNRKNVNYTKFIDFLFLESLLFVVFAITAEPQYLLAIAPFSALLFYLRRDYFYLSGLNIAFFLGLILFFVSGTPMLYLFSNVVPSWQYSYLFPENSLLIFSLSLLYNICLFTIIILHVRASRRSGAFELEKRQKPDRGKIKNHLTRPDTIVKGGGLGFFFVILLSLILVAPATSHTPNIMLFTPQASSADSGAILTGSYNNNSIYTIYSPITWNLTDSYTRNHGTYYLELPEGNVKDSNNFGYYYNVTFNSHYLGTFKNTSTHILSINSAWIKSINNLDVNSNYIPNGTIRLQFELPLDVPDNAIYGTQTYLIAGALSTIVFLIGIGWTIRVVKKC